MRKMHGQTTLKYAVIYLFIVIFPGRFYDGTMTSLRKIPNYVTNNYHLKT